MKRPKQDYIQLSQDDKKHKKTPSLDECVKCGNKCCNYVMIEWDTPVDEEDFDDLRWFVTHRGATVHVDEEEWCVEFKMPCEKLGPDGKCSVYEKRPEMCRDYADNMIEYGVCGGFQNIYETFDHYFETLEQLDDFIPGYLEELEEEFKLSNRIKNFFSDIWEALTSPFQKEASGNL